MSSGPTAAIAPCAVIVVVARMSYTSRVASLICCLQGYGADHENIELLRLRNFTVGRKVEDAEITGPKGMERVLGLLSCIVPFVTHLNSVVMPDGVMEDSDSDEGSSEEASETDSSGVDDE
ncbi:hypothetical protein LTR28_012690 [Elasticomyces elasticus]|nr:hypothetical protein LTR28_012690 [Elasticomyces elasticus]